VCVCVCSFNPLSESQVHGFYTLRPLCVLPGLIFCRIGKEAGYDGSLAACVTSNTHELCVSRYEVLYSKCHLVITVSMSASFRVFLSHHPPVVHASPRVCILQDVLQCVAVCCSVLHHIDICVLAVPTISLIET